MAASHSYLLCATPRTGSTLLCSLLSSTRVAGFPESYFREPDQAEWADAFGLDHDGDAGDYAAFVAAAVAAGTTENGVFAARVMWGTVTAIVDGLDPHSRRSSDLLVLRDALGGDVRFVHLRRRDTVAQAVSWSRAEQTSYWQQGDEVQAEPRLDLAQVGDRVREIDDHNAAWRDWFAAQGVTPLHVEYETLTAQPEQTVRSVLRWMGVDPPAGWVPESPHQRQADGLNAEWASRYRATRPSLPEEPDHGAGGATALTVDRPQRAMRPSIDE